MEIEIQSQPQSTTETPTDRQTEMMGIGVTLVLLFWGPLAAQAYSAFFVRLANSERQCYHETLAKGDRFDLSYVITSASDSPVEFWIDSPSGIRLHHVTKETTANFGFNAELEGQYTYCFANSVSSGEEEVTFTVFGPDEAKKFDDSYVKHDGE